MRLFSPQRTREKRVFAKVIFHYSKQEKKEFPPRLFFTTANQRDNNFHSIFYSQKFYFLPSAFRRGVGGEVIFIAANKRKKSFRKGYFSPQRTREKRVSAEVIFIRKSLFHFLDFIFSFCFFFNYFFLERRCFENTKTYSCLQ